MKTLSISDIIFYVSYVWWRVTY